MSPNDSEKTLRALFEEDNYEYIYIPRIQRDYAQGRTDNESSVIRENILVDVASGKPLSWGIIFGVAEDRQLVDGRCKRCFIPIDGQQRLTTLYLLALYGEKKHCVPFGHLDGFNYETRSASRDFLTALNKNWCGEKEADKNLKEHILNQGWFLNYWALDPTVDAVLNMLTAIDARFEKEPAVFENLDRISFEFLDLKNLNLNETLYLKMNSRGKKLSQFDKIKSEIDKILPDHPANQGGDFRLYEAVDDHLQTLSSFAEKWRYCIDREWSNLFWDRKAHNFDVPMLAFLVNWMVACAGDKYSYAEELLNLNYLKKDFFLPWKYLEEFMNGDGGQKYLEEMASLFNKLYHNRNKYRIAQLIAIPASYSERALQFGLLSFEGDDYDSKEFTEWERFVHNYAVNTVSDKESFFAFIHRIKKDFASHSTDILLHLASLYEYPINELNKQLSEEYFKAHVLVTNATLSPLIRKAEGHPMLNGRLRPLLVNGEQFDETDFAIIWKNFLTWFGEDGHALSFQEGNEESLRKRSAFARAFTKQVVRSSQLFDEWRVLDFAAGTLKDKLQQERFNGIFRTCLLANNLDEISPQPCHENDGIEFIQARDELLQPGVIEGILKWSIGSYLRFKWYYNSLCFYPNHGRSSTDRIGFDRHNNTPGWDRNRNQTLAYLKSKSYVIDAEPVSEDESVALWWGSDIRFHHPEHPSIHLWWDENYHLGIVDKDSNHWVKKGDATENKFFMFIAVGKSVTEIECEINKLINDYLREL